MKLILIILAFMSFNANAIERYKVNDFEPLNEDSVIVYKFFYYGCSHCMRMDKELDYLRDKDGVSLINIPIAFNELSKVAAKHYYTSEVMGVERGFSNDYYRNIVLQRNPVSDNLAISLMSHYAPRRDIINNMDSNYVKNKVEKASEKMLKYKISSTPTFIVNGKYKINAEISGGYENLKKDLNKIIEKELKQEI